MKLLLDTHIWLWSLWNSDRLGRHQFQQDQQFQGLRRTAQLPVVQQAGRPLVQCQAVRCREVRCPVLQREVRLLRVPRSSSRSRMLASKYQSDQCHDVFRTLRSC